MVRCVSDAEGSMWRCPAISWRDGSADQSGQRYVVQSAHRCPLKLLEPKKTLGEKGKTEERRRPGREAGECLH